MKYSLTVISTFMAFQLVVNAQTIYKEATCYQFLPITRTAIIYYSDGTKDLSTNITYDEYGNLYATVNGITYPLIGATISKYYGNEESSNTEYQVDDIEENISDIIDEYYEVNVPKNVSSQPKYDYITPKYNYIAPSTNYYYGTNPATEYQRGYYKDGKWVEPHFKTKRNATNLDNYSTEPNTNIYTGKKGYRAQDYSSDAYNYGDGKIIYTGPRGGQYYYNDKGKKVYVPKRY